MRKRSNPLSTLIVGLFLITSNASISGAATLLDTVTWLNFPKVKQLLSTEGGLEKAARQVGHLKVDIFNPTAAPLDLASLVAASPSIVLCNILSQKSLADLVTNVVQTTLHVRVDEVLKGNAARYLDVVVPGGSVIFDNGVYADVMSTEMKSLWAGEEVIFLLPDVAPSATQIPTNGVEGIFVVSLPDALVTSITSRDPQRHLLSATPVVLSSFRATLLSLSVPLKQ